MNIPQTKTYELTEEEKVPIIKNWLGREGLQLIQCLKNSLKKAYKNVDELFSMLGEKFRPHNNKVILSLQDCKLKRKKMSLPRGQWAGCISRPQTVSINGLDGENIIEGNMKEIMALEDTSEVSTEQVLM